MTDPVVTPSAPASSGADGDNAPAPDEDFSKDYEPVVRLAEVETKTGEEDEDVVFKIRAKLFRFSQELDEWKERGTGDVRLLKHKENKKIRLLMRREKTLKICLNHYVNPTVELGENVGSDRSWVWAGVDYADGERDEATLAIRFRDSASASLFKEAYDKARAEMEMLSTGSKSVEKVSTVEEGAESESKSAEEGETTKAVESAEDAEKSAEAVAETSS